MQLPTDRRTKPTSLARTAISWPFRLLCFRSSLKIQMTSPPRRAAPAPPPFPHLSAADSITSFSSLKKKLLALSPLSSLLSSPPLGLSSVSFELDSVRYGSDRPHAGKVKLKYRPHFEFKFLCRCGNKVLTLCEEL